MSMVASLLAMDRTTLTAALKPLERRGLVDVLVDPEDRRLRRLKLTADGERLLARAVPIWKETHAEVDAQLGANVPDRLRADLLALTRDETRAAEVLSVEA